MQSIELALIELYRNMQRAMVAADTIVLDQLLAEDFHLLHMTGYDQSKKEWLAHIGSGKMRYLSSREEAVNVALADGQARLIGHNLVRANIWGAEGTWKLKLVMRVLPQDRGWRITEAVASTY